MSDISRRDLLKGAAAAGAALAASGAFHPAVAASGAYHAAIAENVDAIAHTDLAPPAPARRQTMRGVLAISQIRSHAKSTRGM